MLNLAGRDYDFGPVLFAVLQECEHRRRGLPVDGGESPTAPASASAPAAPAVKELRALASRKLAEIYASYVEAGGSAGYWRELESEVMDTALPQYTRAAGEQTHLELSSYGLWRQGDPLSRIVLGLGGLAVGGLVVRAPFIPVFEDAFAFGLAAAAFLYPEIRRWFFDWRYSRLLNRLIVQAEAYQHRQLPYVTEAGLEAELSAVSAVAHREAPLAATIPAATATAAAAPAPLPPAALPERQADAKVH